MIKRSSLNRIGGKLINPVIPVFILITVLVFGTTGYYLLWRNENSTFLDALYMTVITITTIGYGEVHPLNDTGRIFTIFVSIAGIGSLFYVLGVFMEKLVIYQLENLGGNRRKMKKLHELENHIIVVGSGRVGKLAASELLKNNEKFVVIELEPQTEEDNNDEILRISGDATQDSVLIKAGIKKARGMIVTTVNPATTVFVVLSARVLNPELFIVARADDDTTVDKLKIAGADKVVNPYEIGGQRLVGLMINPHVVDFFETSFGSRSSEDMSIESIALPDKSRWHDKSLKELNIRQNIGATVLAVIRNNKPLPNPDGGFIIHKGDIFLAMGTKEQLSTLQFLLDRSE